MYSSKYDKQQAFENEYNKYQKDRDNKTQQELRNGEPIYKKEYNKDEFHDKMLKLHNDKNFNPYKILNISKNYDSNLLKKLYKELALKTHPDKGGDPKDFELVTKAYLYLLKKLKEGWGDKQYTEMKDGFDDYKQKQENINQQNIHFSKQKFDIQNFNKVYDEYRVSNPYDQGYNDFINDEEEEEDPTYLFSEEFNINIFNKIFNTKQLYKKKEYVNQQLVQYKEPESINLGSENYITLGQDEINDFSKGYSFDNNSQNLNYTDYKKAHTTTKLVDPNQCSRTEYNTIDDIQKDRSNLSYDMNDEDKLYYEQKKELEDTKEQDRVQRLKTHDKLSERTFDQINRAMLHQYQ